MREYGGFIEKEDLLIDFMADSMILANRFRVSASCIIVREMVDANIYVYVYVYMQTRMYMQPYISILYSRDKSPDIIKVYIKCDILVMPLC